jgi:hypothetical protein
MHPLVVAQPTVVVVGIGNELRCGLPSSSAWPCFERSHPRYLRGALFRSQAIQCSRSLHRCFRLDHLQISSQDLAFGLWAGEQRDDEYHKRTDCGDQHRDREGIVTLTSDCDAGPRGRLPVYHAGRRAPVSCCQTLNAVDRIARYAAAGMRCRRGWKWP